MSAWRFPRSLARCLVLPLLLSPIALAGAATDAQAAPPAGATWAVTVDGRDVRTATAISPLKLTSDELTRVTLTVDNRSAEPVTVRTLRLRGKVFGLTFFNYAMRLDLVVPAGSTADRRIDLDLDDLDRQATGLIPADVELVDANREVLDNRSFVADVQGLSFSVYAVFGLAVAAVTLVLLLSLLLAISRRQLPENRWRRGMQFVPVGLGLGLTATFTLSAVRLLTPSASRWVPLVLILGGAALLVGYLLPLGSTDDPDDESTDGPDQVDREQAAETGPGRRMSNSP